MSDFDGDFEDRLEKKLGFFFCYHLRQYVKKLTLFISKLRELKGGNNRLVCLPVVPPRMFSKIWICKNKILIPTIGKRNDFAKTKNCRDKII